jgi:hypothetical protein
MDDNGGQLRRRRNFFPDHRCPLPPRFDLFRVEWERAGWSHAGQRDAEAGAKRDLLRWRLHAALADWTGLSREIMDHGRTALPRPMRRQGNDKFERALCPSTPGELAWTSGRVALVRERNS